MDGESRSQGRVTWPNRVILVDLPVQLGLAALLAGAGAGSWLLASWVVVPLAPGWLIPTGAIALAVGLGALGLLIGHRIAGPLYAIAHQLSALAVGRFPARRGARRRDLLRSHHLLVQDVLARLRAHEREELARLDEALEALTGPSPRAPSEVVELLTALRASKAAALGRTNIEDGEVP